MVKLKLHVIIPKDAFDKRGLVGVGEGCLVVVGQVESLQATRKLEAFQMRSHLGEKLFTGIK